MNSLYDYIKEIDEIIYNATDEDGVISDEVIEKLDTLEISKSEKVDNCIKYYKSRKALAEALKAEKLALAHRQQVAENEAERMKAYLQFCLQGSKWESVAGKVSYRKSKAVEIDDEGLLPDEYKIISYKPDKAGMKKSLEEGAEIPGAHLEERVSAVIK